MTTLRLALYGAALLGALALLLWGNHQQFEAEKGRTAVAQERLATVNARVERDTTTIATLRTTLADERQAQSTLQQLGQDLRRELDVRKQQIKELKRENAELREWAVAQLPAAARRLRQRPTITGAAAYRDWLSGRNALHPERD
ncbi:Rz-like lysis system protein LysB [Pseudomonas hormoni]